MARTHSSAMAPLLRAWMRIAAAATAVSSATKSSFFQELVACRCTMEGRKALPRARSVRDTCQAACASAARRPTSQMPSVPSTASLTGHESTRHGSINVMRMKAVT